MAVLTTPVAVPRTVLLRVWEREGLGELPPVFGADDIYVSLTAERAYDEACVRVLAELGLADGEMLTREFRVALRVVASPNRELYCWSKNGRRFSASTAGGEGVAVQVQGDMAVFAGFEERNLMADFISELPPYRPAHIPALHVTRGAFEQREEARSSIAADRQDSMPQLARLMKAQREDSHQVYVRGISGDRYRRSKPFTVYDLRDHGRVVTFTDGRGDIHCLPGTAENLASTFAATWQSMT
ncbi:hypothetical protein BJF85_14575 [Saccharomonospora sp. CUA-673]|uniref:ESX secretion-associated protein EspG n=1 Tax=Saccharomonospora sp. CUA-673 TaxID=1904969 RepID=UPI00095D98F5|nr:ESX secretion-associated protein EspG [Saccharomonospora sp. CUA-673]OLT47850.1 hypothetical protein BJF85_14575 [Saccharomonospora sp. CUA-673]